MKRNNSARPVWWKLLAMPAIALVGLIYLSPVWGLAAISRGRFTIDRYQPDASDIIPVAGVFYTVSLLVLVFHIVQWLTTGRRKSGFHQVYASMTMVLGAITAVVVKVRGTEEAAEGWEMWAIPITVAAATGAVFLVCSLVADLRRAARDEAADQERISLVTNH